VTVPALAGAVEAEMDRIGLGSAHLVGNSMGGWIAVELARRARARTVTAISPIGMATPSERRFERVSLIASRAASRATAPVAGALTRSRAGRTAAWQMFARPRRLTQEQAARAIRAMAGATSYAEARRFITSQAPDGLDEVRCPVTIAWGTKDRLLRPRQAPRWVAAIPGARLVELPGLGHAPMSDDPELVAATIVEGATRSPT
jgi:pimeloyl-ACP methyl ester carboxylesterase